jgi:hypothetical protein
LKCNGLRADTRFRLSAKGTSPFKSTGVSVQSTTGSRGVRLSGSNVSNAGYTMFRGSVKGTGYSLHSPGFPSLPYPCVTVCNQISTGLYLRPARANINVKAFENVTTASFRIIFNSLLINYPIIQSYTGCFKKSFTALKAYRNLYRRHTQRFELSKCSKTHLVLPRIVIRNCFVLRQVGGLPHYQWKSH